MIVSLVGGPHCGQQHAIQEGPGAKFHVNGVRISHQCQHREFFAEVYEPYEFQDEEGNAIDFTFEPEEMPARALCKYVGTEVKEEGC